MRRERAGGGRPPVAAESKYRGPTTVQDARGLQTRSAVTEPDMFERAREKSLPGPMIRTGQRDGRRLRRYNPLSAGQVLLLPA